MRLEDIHIGDVLCVRAWEDLAAEFTQVDDDGGLDVNDTYFNPNMRSLCGRRFTVSEIGKRYLRSEENIEEKEGVNNGYWHINAEMLEPFVDDIVDVEALNKELHSFLGIS